MAGKVGRVAVILRVNAPGKSAKICSPPEGDDSLWTKKLCSRLQPLEANAFGCCLLGSLAEVSSHLWQHQALWLRLHMAAESECEHITVQFSELIDPLADFTTWHYANEVCLEDEEMLLPQKGSKVSLSVELTAIHLACQEVLAQPEMSCLLNKQSRDLNAYRLTVSFGRGRAACEHLAADNGIIQLRFDTVEHQLPMQRSSEDLQVTHTLVMADDIAELPEALSALQVCLQVSDPGGSGEQVELPVDLSPLVACCMPEGGSGEVTAEVESSALPAIGGGVPLLATLEPFSWSANHGEDLLPGRPRDADVWAAGARLLAVGLRLWRLSIEVRSIRLSARDANVYVSYSYPPLHQPRAFRTSPPTPVRKKVTMNLPHAFAAHVVTVSFDELEVLLQDPLIVEVWHRDVYRKDSVVGVAEASLSQVLAEPLQHSANLPSMVEGFRVVDQVCPVLCEDGSQVGVLRLLVFLEDLGPARDEREAPVPPVLEGTTRPSVRQENPAEATSVSGVDAVEAVPSILRSAYGLELWRQAEEDKFRAYLAEQEAGLKARLEEEYRQREEARAADFAQRQAKIQHVETVVRRKLQELHQKELAITSEEARVGNLQLAAKREAEMAVSQREDTAKQEMAQLSHSLELSRARSQFLEEQVGSMQAQLSAASAKLHGLEKEQSERDAELQAKLAPSPELKEELKELRLRLHEQQVRGQAIADSRDHFKHKVEELCHRLLGSVEPAFQEKALTALEAFGTGIPGTEDVTDVTQSIIQSLRKVREELDNLASNWDKASTRQEEGQTSQKREPERPSCGTTSVWQEPEQAEQHLAWLRAQRRQLLESGLYGSSDAVVLALDVKIAQAEAQMN